MSISSEITRISQNVANSLTAVASKGATVPSGSNSDDLPTLIASLPSTKSVTYNLTGGASASVTPSEVVAGQGFSVKLKAPAGYDLSGVTITMGGVDITSQVFTPDASGGGSEPVLDSKTITANGTYTASDDDLDGYSEVLVDVPWSWMGSEVESLGTLYEAEMTLDDTNFPSWTASTTAGSVLATATVGTISANMTEYEYFIHWQCRVDVVTNEGATLKAQIIRECQSAWQSCFRRPNSLANIQAGNSAGNTCLTMFSAPLLHYYNSSGSQTYTFANTYGIYQALQAATFSSATSNTPTITVKRPVLTARCNSSYFATGRKAEIDTADSTVKFICKAYRVPIGGVVRDTYESLIDLYNE